METKHVNLLLVLLLISACSASKQAFKEAKEYEQRGLYVEAAEADLHALKKDAKFKEAKSHLKKIAPFAYNELLTRAQKIESSQQDWDQTVVEYSHLNNLLEAFNRQGVVLETVNVKERLQKAKQNAAAYHYSNAEDLLARKSWDKAGNAYLKANEYVDNYNSSFAKAIKSFLNSGNELLQQKEYEHALQSYFRVLDVAPGHSEAKAQIAECHFQYGHSFFDNGDFRKALSEFEKVKDYNTDYPALKEWTEKAYQNAMQYVAIFPFLNNTRLHVDGYRIASDLTTYAEHANLDFADFLPYPEVVALLGRTGLVRYGRVSESELAGVAAVEGLDSFVWGVVREIEVREHPEKMHEYAHDRVFTAKDSAGRDVEKTETIYYREYTKERQVIVKLECTIIQTETGHVLNQERYREEITDLARWVAYRGSIYDLPKEKRDFLDAPHSPKPVDVLIDELLVSVVRKIGQDVVRFYE